MAAIVCAPLLGIAQLQLTLTPSNYNGSNISCFGKKDGAIDLSVTGGTPPYTFGWSTGATTEDVVNLPSGYYKVEVIDADSAVVHGEITLLDPNPIKLTAEANEYANGYHISCYSCYNGSINVTTTGGTAPYSYVWRDGTTTEDRSGLGARDYTVTMTDANGCTTEPRSLTLREPERSDWMMSGNANTIPGTHFFGTTDAKDVVFKSNGVERLRIKSNGDVEVGSLTGSVPGLLVSDENGVLKQFSDSDIPVLEDVCPGHAYPWTRCGNSIVYAEYLGTNNAMPLFIKTNNVLRMTVSKDGKVGIGTTPPVGEVEGYRLYVADGIQTRDVLVKLGTWEDYVFAESYHLMPLAELREYLRSNQHMPSIPSASELESRGGLELGAIAHALTRTVEEQALYILQLEERLAKMEQRLGNLEAAK
ncbi:MAG: SprB repeat-containing protein [Flavobacteriales bacterium]|nr:SprB repeat-containing protein [Flavobacteriales bacterium]